jgi:hypothetical protein
MAHFDPDTETQHREARASRKSAKERREALRLEKAQRKFDKQQQRILAFLPSVLEAARERAKENYRRGGTAGGEADLPLFRTVLYSAREDSMSPFVKHTKIGRFLEDKLDELSVDGWSYRVVLDYEMFLRRRITGIRAQRQ